MRQPITRPINPNPTTEADPNRASRHYARDSWAANDRARLLARAYNTPFAIYRDDAAALDGWGRARYAVRALDDPPEAGMVLQMTIHGDDTFEFPQHAQPCSHNAMRANTDARGARVIGFAWRCDSCGYVYGGGH